MNKERLDDLQKLLRLLPSDNNWEFDKENLRIIDPHGCAISLESEQDIGEVTKAIYLETFSTLVNELSDILKTIHDLRVTESSLRNELEHFKGRSKHIYNRALEDVETVIQNTPIYSRSARDALNSVIENIQILYDSKRVPAKLDKITE